MGALAEPVRLSSPADLRDYLILAGIKEETAFYLFEEEVIGATFIELTEEDLRSNFPKLNFGQRKSCLKVINSILKYKEKFIFTNENDSISNVPQFDSSEIKDMDPQQLSSFLQEKCSDILQRTIDNLLNEEVDGESFLDFTEESLLSNFPAIASEQRQAILKVVASCKIIFLDLDQAHKFDNHNVADIPSDDDLGCRPLQAFIDKDGALKAITGANIEIVDLEPCVSASFLKKKPRKRNENAQKRPKFIPEEVKPIDVLSVLELSHEGEKVRDFIRANKYCDRTHQTIMMRILFEHHCQDKESPVKYYPLSMSKVAMAKGIVKDFPELADTGEDCKWASWLDVVQTKFETVQAKLLPSQKKNKKSSSETTKPASKKAVSSVRSCHASSANSSANPSASSSLVDEESEENIQNQIRILGHMLPTGHNKELIKLALSHTFSYRRNWIAKDQPSVTDVLKTYKHLRSYEGEMISAEFSLMEPFHNDLVSKFKRYTPVILKYAQSIKGPLYQEVSDKFFNDDVKALVLIPKLLTVTLNKNIATPQELEHVQNFKQSIETVPSSALFQIAPEGTCVESYESLETHPVSSEQVTPIYPFLLWLTNDFKTGMIYLKVDKLSMLIGRGDDDDFILQAFDIFVKFHHVFMVHYHPYLRTTLFDFSEFLYSIKKPCNSVQRFVTTLRNLALK